MFFFFLNSDCYLMMKHSSSVSASDVTIIQQHIRQLQVQYEHLSRNIEQSNSRGNQQQIRQGVPEDAAGGSRGSQLVLGGLPPQLQFREGVPEAAAGGSIGGGREVEGRPPQLQFREGVPEAAAERVIGYELELGGQPQLQQFWQAADAAAIGSEPEVSGQSLSTSETIQEIGYQIQQLQLLIDQYRNVDR